MANHTTGAQRYNKRMDKIFEQAKINTNNWGDGIMNKHTPGPWKIYSKGMSYVTDSKDNLICDTFKDTDCDFEMAVANARLIAASPDLLEACENAVKFMASGSTPYNLLWDVIHKAKGTKPY